MTTPTNGPVVAGSAIAAVMTFAPFGVSFTTLVLGGACFFGGCCANTGMSLYIKLEGNEPFQLRDFFRAIAALMCCVPLAAVASCVVFLGAHVIGVQADAAFGGLLLLMGVRGVKGFQWIMDTFTNVFTKIAPGNKPTGGGP